MTDNGNLKVSQPVSSTSTTAEAPRTPAWALYLGILCRSWPQISLCKQADRRLTRLVSTGRPFVFSSYLFVLEALHRLILFSWTQMIQMIVLSIFLQLLQRNSVTGSFPSCHSMCPFLLTYPLSITGHHDGTKEFRNFLSISSDKHNLPYDSSVRCFQSNLTHHPL